MNWELAPQLSVIFRHHVKNGSFSACLRLADIFPVPNKSPSSNVGDNRRISIYPPPLPAKAYEKIVARKLSNFLKSNSLLLAFQCLCRRGLETCNALLTLSNHLQVTLNRGMEGRLNCYVKLFSCT